MVATKDRILFTSAELFRRKGYTGTGLKEVTTQAQAPFGSLYHHYPGGKEELGEDVIRVSGAFFLQLFVFIADDADDLVSGVQAFFDGAGETLVATGWQDACPIAVIALEVASTSERLRVATADVFESWLAEAQGRYIAAGILADRARALALSFLCALEGAFILCRALRSTEPMAAAGAATVAELRRELDRPAF